MVAGLSGYRNCQRRRNWNKIVYLVKGHPTNAQLQYNGAWITGLNVAKMNYYGNQSSLWIGEIDTVDDADINSI